MNDYYVDERLIKEFKDITEPVKEPYPKKAANYNSMNLSNNASLKKEMNDLDGKYKNLEKAYNKIDKKNKEITEEIKSLKIRNDTISKDYNILRMSNEKIVAEKSNLENILEENKNYTRKIESRLVSGAKNQYLVEINNKLRKETEDLKVSI